MYLTTFDELKKEFDDKVQKLRDSCLHTNLSEWMDYQWAPAHSTGIEVKICNRCQKIIEERTKCWSCGNYVEKPDWIKGDGHILPSGTYFCSKQCAENYKKTSRR